MFSARSFGEVAKAFVALKEIKGIAAVVCIAEADLHFRMGRMMQSIFQISFPDSIRSSSDAAVAEAIARFTSPTNRHN